MRTKKFHALALAAVIGLAGCEKPTFPEWDVTMGGVVVSDTIKVAELTPADIRVENGEFELPSTSVQDSLNVGGFCSQCSAFEGMEWYYPAFTHVTTEEATLPADLVETTLSAGTLELGISHDLPYTLLRSDNGTYGSLTVEVLDAAGTVQASNVLRGEDDPLAPNTTARVSVDMRNVRVAPGLQVRVTLKSPGSGGRYPIRMAAKFRFQADVAGMKTPAVTIQQDGIPFSKTSLELPMSQEDRAKMVGKLVRGTVDIALDFPFSITGRLNIGIASSQANANAGNYLTSVRGSLRQGANTIRLQVDEAKMAELLNSPGIFVVSDGGLDAGTFTLRATDQVVYKAALETVYTVNKN